MLMRSHLLSKVYQPARTRMINRYGFFVLEVVKAWIDPTVREPRTPHHRGRGQFMVAGETIKLPSRMK